MMANFTVTAEVVLYVQATPATVFTQEPQCQIPTARLLILVLPQGASVLSILLYFNLQHFPEGGTITGSIFTHSSNLLGAFSHVAAN